MHTSHVVTVALQLQVPEVTTGKGNNGIPGEAKTDET